MTVNFNFLIDFLTQPASDVIFQLFSIIGWTFFAWLFLYLGIYYYMEYKLDKYKADWKWILLAVDIPQENVQTPKAVEQMFSHLAGAYRDQNIADKFYHGKKQRSFSFEIIGIEGYIQFLVRTEEKFRELVETAIYAQYPDAEIVEVEDYTTDIPGNYPNETHDIWATGFSLAEDDSYPIRSYREFEHSISKDTVLKDPMGTLLESFSRIGQGEQMWLQIIVEPISNSWKEKAIEKIKDLIGEKKKFKKTAGDYVSDAFYKSLEAVGDEVFLREPSVKKEEKSEEKNQLKYMTPGQSKILEAMEDKISKIGFKTKIRAIYVARKEVYRPARGINALVGAMNQYNIPTANSIVPSFKANTSYFFKKSRDKYRKELLMRAYKKRKANAGASTYVMNIEELATIWHFPMSHVKTPLVQKAEGKRVEPPIGLPTEEIPDLPLQDDGEDVEDEEKKVNLYRTDAGEVNDSEEFRFG